MKKIIFTFVLIIAFSLSACQVAPDNSSTNANSNYGLTCIELPAFDDINEYNTFVTTSSSIHDDFIHYERIKILGSFLSVIFQDKDSEYKHMAYSYSLADENGFRYSFSIIHGPNPFSLDKPAYQINDQMKSMLDCESNDPYYIIKSGRYYSYNSGMLVNIIWQENGITYCLGLSGLDKSKDYPLDGETTFLTRVFSLDDKVSSAAFAELSASLNS